MWIFLLILLAVILTVYYSSKQKHSRGRKFDQQVIKQSDRVAPITRIEDCLSREDYQYQASNEVRKVVACVEASKASITAAANETNKNVSTAWLKSYERIITVSTNLEKNLQYYSDRNLEQTKFRYYTSLHFRSMIAADITYREYLKINDSFNEINKFIVEIAKNSTKTKIPKSAIYNAKDSLKQLRNVFLNRIHEMNHQTEKLRDKIGAECGARGKIWWEERTRNRK